MHFTEGMPIVVFLDLFDTPSSPFGSIVKDVTGKLVGWPQGQVLIDGVVWPDDSTGLTTMLGTTMTDTNGNPSPIDLYRMEAASVPAGSHQLVGQGLFQDLSTATTDPIGVIVDPWPNDKQQMTINGNTTINNVNWSNMAIRANGGTLTLKGNVTIKDSLITGLGQITTGDGTVGTVDIEDSIFENTGVLQLTITGGATVTNNEFRANNQLNFVPNDPNVPTVILFKGNSTDDKVFQGNRVGAGRVEFNGVSNWLIGGDTDDVGNILIGPRCTLNVIGSSQMTLRGNYSHHNYRGGWSQGFNFYYYNSTVGMLTEHNLIRNGSWPVQGVGGEFRYNVVYGYGHNWIRSAGDGTSIHHNLFLPDGAGSLDEGLLFYSGEAGLQIYNNTFDGGANTGDFSMPMVRATGTTQISSLRNDLFTYSRDQANGNPGDASIAFSDTATYQYADYNAFYSPDNSTKDNYDITIGGTSEGSPGFGGHDVSGNGAVGVMDGQLSSSPYAGSRVYPFEGMVDEAAVWQKTQRLSTILAGFRAPYTPKSGDAIINVGDPNDNDSQGRRADIGAIDADGHDQDKLGKFGVAPSETVPPPVLLTGPDGSMTITGIVDLSATAQDNQGGSGVVLVQFLVDGITVGQIASSPYTVSYNTSSLTSGTHSFAAKAWDGAGNSAVSDAITVTVMVTANPDGGITPPHGGNGGAGGALGYPKVVGSCSCSTSPQGRWSGSVLMLAVIGLPLALRRRRRQRRGCRAGGHSEVVVD